MKMSEEVKKCIKEAVYIPFCSAGTHRNNWGNPPYGCHMLQTRSDFIIFPDDETIAWPAAGMSGTQSNLIENGKIQILAILVKDGKLVNGYRIEGNGEFHKDGRIFDQFKQKYDWANGCVVMKVARIGQSRELTKVLLKYE